MMFLVKCFRRTSSRRRAMLVHGPCQFPMVSVGPRTALSNIKCKGQASPVVRSRARQRIAVHARRTSATIGHIVGSATHIHERVARTEGEILIVAQPGGRAPSGRMPHPPCDVRGLDLPREPCRVVGQAYRSLVAGVVRRVGVLTDIHRRAGAVDIIDELVAATPEVLDQELHGIALSGCVASIRSEGIGQSGRR